MAQVATVFKYSTEGIIILNSDKLVHCANDAFYSITKYQERHLKNKELPFLTNQSLGETIYKDLWQSIEKRGHWREESKHLIKTKKRSIFGLLSDSSPSRQVWKDDLL